MIKKCNADVFLDGLDGLNSHDKLVYITNYINDNYIYMKSNFFEVENDLELRHVVSRAFFVSINEIRKKYSLYEYEKIKTINRPILDVKNLFEISPLLINIELWKELVYYELSIISPLEIEYRVNYFMECIENLKRVLSHDEVYDFSNFPEVESFEIKFKEGKIYSFTENGFSFDENAPLISRGVFNVNLNSFSRFLENINIEENQKRIEICNYGSENILVKGLVELFRSMKFDLPDSFYKNQIPSLVNSLLNGDKNSFKNENFSFLKGKKNKSINNRIDLVKYFVFLSHSGYILNNQTETIKIISSFLNSGLDLGFGLRTLQKGVKRNNYYIFSDETEGGKSNRRRNLISTVLHSNKKIHEIYQNSPAHKDLQLHQLKNN
ncbi:hypothetical protein EV195_101308 [Tenacibaculum skagerrakense]|uniref:Uncharacterized protein n=2 Tax=Tenacibaculum skagerrakense TaxID=186571 RepID=A0A4R2P225_9FLAO|nr:hypothetical protein EV195_101308 [Tenacibaculum skagerrakense]